VQQYSWGRPFPTTRGQALRATVFHDIDCRSSVTPRFRCVRSKV
jgi:hypothetical protein